MNKLIKQNSIKALRKAIEMCGGQSALARQCGVTQQSVNQWLIHGVPAHRILEVERATNGQVTRHEINNLIYPVN